MKFKIIAIIAIIVVMLFATVAYLATKNSDQSQTIEEVQ